MPWGVLPPFNYIFREKFTQLLAFRGTGKVFLNRSALALHWRDWVCTLTLAIEINFARILGNAEHSQLMSIFDV